MDETNVNLPEPAPVIPNPEPKKIHKHVAIIIAVVVLALAAAGAFWLKSRTVPNPPSNNNKQDETNQPDTTTTATTDEPLVSGLIKWQYPSYAFADFVLTDHRASSDTYYKVGTFISGKYQGADINIGNVNCDCLGGGQVRFISRTGNLNGQKPYVILQKYSYPLDSFNGYFDSSKYEVDSTTIISDLEPPAQIGTAPKELSRTEYGFFGSTYNKFNATNLKFVYNDPKVGAVYTTPDDPTKVDSLYTSNGFYVKAPDWSALLYTLKPNFVKEDNTSQFTWNNGTANTQQYVYTDRTGCGSNLASVVLGSVVNLQTDLVKAGVTVFGDSIYELTDKNHKLLQDLYNNEYNPYDGPKLSYDQFLAKHPLFFWVDPFGRMIKFKNNDFQPQAECGKPVIYLYPTQAEQVSVKLTPVGGFSYTEPAYNSGWNVLAQPSGQLTNLADGKNYPYLFWEGRGGLYQTPDRGFVVAAVDVHEFFNSKLSQLGLNAQEIADFEEYWEPFFAKAPYYFITFMGNSVMDNIAPLEISPKPDTVIRILMDFKPLNQPVPVQGYEIQTPIRRGFTVVEWGGVKP